MAIDLNLGLQINNGALTWGFQCKDPRTANAKAAFDTVKEHQHMFPDGTLVRLWRFHGKDKANELVDQFTTTKGTATSLGAVLASKTPRSARKRYWSGSPPQGCDLCDSVDGLGGLHKAKVFYDAKTRQGPWGILCEAHFKSHGVGLGLGRGQKYKLQDDGRWLKVEG